MAERKPVSNYRDYGTVEGRNFYRGDGGPGLRRIYWRTRGRAVPAPVGHSLVALFKRDCVLALNGRGVDLDFKYAHYRRKSSTHLIAGA